LPAANRPPQVAQWMKECRQLTKMPAINNLEEYAGGWWSWWLNIQPSWHSRDEDGQLRCSGAGGLWASAQKPGKNGFLLVLLSLSWWREAVAGQGGEAVGTQLARWTDAVGEVEWVLSVMGCELRLIR
ncbi:hypothetical protein JAAARDRAFT_137834, partial [Jaapia argillacea MUCL 33604]